MTVQCYVAMLRSGKHKSVYLPGLRMEIPISNPTTSNADIADALESSKIQISDLRFPIIQVIKMTKDYLSDEGRPIDDFIKVIPATMEV